MRDGQTMRLATLLLGGLLTLGAVFGPGQAAVSPVGRDVLVRDCLARFGHELLRPCEVVAVNAGRRGASPTVASCLALAERHGIGGSVRRKLCRYYFTER